MLLCAIDIIVTYIPGDNISWHDNFYCVRRIKPDNTMNKVRFNMI